jgi:hypothetical protein
LTSNVVELDVLTTLDIDPERILNRALAEEPESILVVGWCKDGSLYFDRSMASYRKRCGWWRWPRKSCWTPRSRAKWR